VEQSSHYYTRSQLHRYSWKRKKRLASVWRSPLTSLKLHRERTLPGRIIIYTKKKEWGISVLLNLKKCKKPSVLMKSKIGIIPWHHTKDHASSTCLHRLRSGNTHLNSFTHQINNEANPSCRFGCPEIENHVLIVLKNRPKKVCPPKRPPPTISVLLPPRKTPSQLWHPLGLDPNIYPRLQLKINNLLSTCITKTNIHFTA
jgi:hypothetical protein